MAMCAGPANNAGPADGVEAHGDDQVNRELRTAKDRAAARQLSLQQGTHVQSAPRNAVQYGGGCVPINGDSAALHCHRVGARHYAMRRFDLRHYQHHWAASAICCAGAVPVQWRCWHCAVLCSRAHGIGERGLYTRRCAHCRIPFSVRGASQYFIPLFFISRILALSWASPPSALLSLSAALCVPSACRTSRISCHARAAPGEVSVAQPNGTVETNVQRAAGGSYFSARMHTAHTGSKTGSMTAVGCGPADLAPLPACEREGRGGLNAAAATPTSSTDERAGAGVGACIGRPRGHASPGRGRQQCTGQQGRPVHHAPANYGSAIFDLLPRLPIPALQPSRLAGCCWVQSQAYSPGRLLMVQ